MIGCGRVGLATGVALALAGHPVAFTDTDQARLAALAGGRLPFQEPGLGEALLAARDKVRFTADLGQALAGCEVALIAIGTPATTGRPDPARVAHLDDVVQALARSWPARSGSEVSPVVVVKSTVRPGTTRAAGAALRSIRPDIDWHVAANPEFLRQGTALSDALRPWRVVIGADSELARARLAHLYREVIEDREGGEGAEGGEGGGGRPVVWTSPESAEMAKLAANAFLAARVALINEVAGVCEEVGADIADVARIVGLDPRLGPNYLEAGPGFGGSCLPKDLGLLIRAAETSGCIPVLPRAILTANERQRQRLLGRIGRLLGPDGLRGKKVAVLGLSFKPGTDDLRGSPSLALAWDLAARGAAVAVYDPVAGPADLAQALEAAGPEDAGGQGGFRARGEPVDPRREPPRPCSSVQEAAEGADAAILATPWSGSAALDWADLAHRMRRLILVDPRNALDPELVRGHGFIYLGVGRGDLGPG